MIKQVSFLFFHLFASFSFLICQERTVGLFLNSPESYNGYTLLGNNETTYLIDNCGSIVNLWKSQYKTGHGMYLMDNGDLLRAGQTPGSFDAGGRGGVFELYNWNGQLKWSFQIASEERHAHHDIALLPNGNFLCTVWVRHSEEEAQLKGRIYSGEVWSESILELEIGNNNEARIIWEWSVWDHLVQDVDSTLPNYGEIHKHPELLNINYIGEGQDLEGNWLHINAINYNKALDQIVFSSRFLSEIYVIDHSTTTLEASGHSGGFHNRGGDILYRYGNPQVFNQGTGKDQELNGQHNIQWIPTDNSHKGEFIVFNNEYIPGQKSRIQIFNSPDSSGFYQYNDTNGYGSDTLIYTYCDVQLYSDILSGAQPLPNGNILITEGRSGHIYEVSMEDEIVWDYIFPVNRNGGPAIQGGEPRFNTIFKAHRYDPDFVGFQDKDLTPGIPVELSPFDNDCILVDSLLTKVHDPEETTHQFRLVSNPVSSELIIANESNGLTPVSARLYNFQGKFISTHPLAPGINSVHIPELIPGVYILTILSKRETRLVTRFVKF